MTGRAGRAPLRGGRRWWAAGWARPGSPAQRDELYKARLELRKELLLEQAKSRLATRKARADQSASEDAAHSEAIRRRVEAEEAADRASSAAFCGAVIDVAKGALDRARTNAEFVQKAAAAIFTLYTGALTVSFSVTNQPLPSRGILPSVFLGLAIVLATGYVAFLTRGGTVAHPAPADGRAQAELNRVTTFVHWVNVSRFSRAWMLRSSIVALAVGVFVLPAPFVSLPRTGSVVAPTSVACSAPLVADEMGSGACVPAWPVTPSGAGELELRKLAYASQLAEATAARNEARSRAQRDGSRAESSDISTLVGGLGIGLVLVLLPALVAATQLRKEGPRDVNDDRKR